MTSRQIPPKVQCIVSRQKKSLELLCLACCTNMSTQRPTYHWEAVHRWRTAQNVNRINANSTFRTDIETHQKFKRRANQRSHFAWKVVLMSPCPGEYFKTRQKREREREKNPMIFTWSLFDYHSGLPLCFYTLYHINPYKASVPFLDLGKQCRPRSDAAEWECGVWSGFTLFANRNIYSK